MYHQEDITHNSDGDEVYQGWGWYQDLHQTPVPPKWQVRGVLQASSLLQPKADPLQEEVSCPRAFCQAMNQFGERALESGLGTSVMRDHHELTGATKER